MPRPGTGNWIVIHRHLQKRALYLPGIMKHTPHDGKKAVFFLMQTWIAVYELDENQVAVIGPESLVIGQCQ